MKTELPGWTEAAVNLMVELIQNECVNTGDVQSGSERRSVASIQTFLGDEGTVVEPMPGRASVIYRIEGSDSRAPKLLLIPHLDVVPAEEGGWLNPPFAGTVSDGFIWGRGAVDMLNVTSAMVCVFRALRDGDLPAPVGDVILAAVADEEAGGALGAKHLVDHHWSLIACDYVLTEVAGPIILGPSGSSLPVTVAEKGPAWRHFNAAGISGHGSQPYARRNAVLTLATAFARIGSYPQPILVTDEWKRFVPHLPVGKGLQSRLIDADQIDAAVDQIALDDPTLARWIHACTHLTLSPNVLGGGSKPNVIPDGASGDVDVRLLPGQGSNDIDEHLRKILDPELLDELEIRPILEMSANSSPPEGMLWESIADAAERHLGSRSLAPTMTPVTTDARFFRERGIPAYGVGWFDDSTSFSEMLAMFHGVNERVSVRSVQQTTEFLGTVIGALGKRALESEG